MSLYLQRCRLEWLIAKSQQVWGLITGNNYHVLKGRYKELSAIIHEKTFIAKNQRYS